MPQKIQYSNGNKAEYFYDASGVKYKAQWGFAVNTQNIPLGATGTENNSLTGVTRTEYCGNYVYEQGILRRIITPEGFVSTSNDVSTTGIKYTWRYNYFLKDHLGNTRRTLRSNTLSSISTTLSAFSEIIDYYPFGMEVTEVYNPNGEDYSMSYLAGSSTPNLYNGKEIDRMHGLNMYDYGARWKDLNWTTIDPLAEKYYSISPYVYCKNNPIRFIDPDGKADWDAVYSGALTATGGGFLMAGGAGLASTGAGSIVGGFLIIDGMSMFAFGVGKMVCGFASNNTEQSKETIKNSPNSVVDVAGIVASEATGDENNCTAKKNY